MHITYPYIIGEYVKYRILNVSAEFPKGESTAWRIIYTSNSPFRNTDLTLCEAGRYSIWFSET